MSPESKKPIDVIQRVREESIGLIDSARTNGFLVKAEGSLEEVLNGVYEAAYSSSHDGNETAKIFRAKIHNFAQFYTSEEVQRALPFFGTQVSEDKQGNTHITFAD